MRLVGWFLVVVGVAIAGLWVVLLLTGQVAELQDGRVDIVFHLVAELVTAALLVVGGIVALRAHPLGRLLAAVGCGALGYTTVNSAGYYAQAGDWAMVGLFGVLLVATLGALIVLGRTEAVATRQGIRPAA
jgi:hypothetical protein